MKKIPSLFAAACTLFIRHSCSAQPLNQKENFSRQDTLRGTINSERNWWDVYQYNIWVKPDYSKKFITGSCEIVFTLKQTGTKKVMQIDLQHPLEIDSIKLDYFTAIKDYKKEGNVYHVNFGNIQFVDNAKPPLPRKYRLTVYYHGYPRIAVNPPWDGGWIFTKDKKGRPWMSVACQGLGASVWYPCKDHQSDEPDNGATLSMTVDDSLVAVGNGRLKEKKQNNNGTTTWKWEVTSPINNYNIIPYIGKYEHWHDEYNGEKGKLDLDYWVLDYELEKAKKQFEQVKPMLKCFEWWFGPYPFYEDGYKLVQSPHLGMEHQSAVAYGNQFRNGYLGMDLSGSGWGKNWDYIIVHESGHEWFGNNITTKDIADMWVHEGFTDYSETLYVQCQYGKEAADAYTLGLRRKIQNDEPLIGPYGVNREGSSDMYNKGNNIIHTLRQVIDDDSLFRKILRGLNKTFYHQTVTSKEVEEYFSRQAGKDLSKIFDQYLRTTNIPVLEYNFVQDEKKPDRYQLQYRWANCINGFNMPVKIKFADKMVWIHPTTQISSVEVSAEDRKSMNSDLAIDKNFYIRVRKVSKWE
ncbi:MAG: peptidase M1 [Chitinophagaceae bacterium]